MMKSDDGIALPVLREAADIAYGHNRIIRFSSRFVECVDAGYKYRGLYSFIVFVPIVYYWWKFCDAVWFECISNRHEHLCVYPGSVILSLIVILVFGVIISWFSWKVFGRDYFRFTHYPIRIDRQNRMLYVFRLDGSVLRVSWEDVHFVLAMKDAQLGIASWEVRGHVLEADRKTVRETFALPYVAADPYEVQTMWEWVRRYMEGDPKPLYDGLDYCLPIDQKREPWLLGPKMILMETPPTVFYWALMVPVALMAWVGRRISLATCRIPVWPPDIEAACAIDPDDPYVKDGRTHPPDAGMWFPGGRQVD